MFKSDCSTPTARAVPTACTAALAATMLMFMMVRVVVVVVMMVSVSASRATAAAGMVVFPVITLPFLSIVCPYFFATAVTIRLVARRIHRQEGNRPYRWERAR